MLLSKPFQIGKLQGIIFTLEKVGDVFPTHTHGEHDIHITVVANGRLRCMGRPEIEGKEISAGMVLDWNPGEAHGFTALTDGAKLVNILKGV